MRNTNDFSSHDMTRAPIVLISPSQHEHLKSSAAGRISAGSSFHKPISQPNLTKLGHHTLPFELWIHVFSYLDYVSLIRVSRVNRFWHMLADQDGLWKLLCHSHGVLLLAPSSSSISSQQYKNSFATHQIRLRQELRARLLRSFLVDEHLKIESRMGITNNNMGSFGFNQPMNYTPGFVVPCAQCQKERQEYLRFMNGGHGSGSGSGSGSNSGSISNSSSNGNASNSGSQANSTHTTPPSSQPNLSGVGAIETQPSIGTVSQPSLASSSSTSSQQQSSSQSQQQQSSQQQQLNQPLPFISTHFQNFPTMRSTMLLHTLTNGCELSAAVREFRMLSTLSSSPVTPTTPITPSPTTAPGTTSNTSATTTTTQPPQHPPSLSSTPLATSPRLFLNVGSAPSLSASSPTTLTPVFRVVEVRRDRGMLGGYADEDDEIRVNNSREYDQEEEEEYDVSTSTDTMDSEVRGGFANARLSDPIPIPIPVPNARGGNRRGQQSHRSSGSGSGSGSGSLSYLDGSFGDSIVFEYFD